jgi:hypothetical protein
MTTDTSIASVWRSSCIDSVQSDQITVFSHKIILELQQGSDLTMSATLFDNWAEKTLMSNAQSSIATQRARTLLVNGYR